jgi:hypothetical protein
MRADLADGPPGSKSGVPDLCPLPPILAEGDAELGAAAQRRHAADHPL